MKVLVTGWARNLGPSKVLDRSISAKSLVEELYPLPKETLKFKVDRQKKVDSRGSVKIVSEANNNLTLNGNYEVSVEISAKELMILVSEITKNLSIGEIVDHLISLRAESDL